MPKEFIRPPELDPTDPVRVADVNLIMDAVDASGLSARRFAEWVAWRDERTVRRWSAGTIEIPGSARKRLVWFLGISEARRRAFIEIITSSKVADREETTEWQHVP